MEIIVQPKPEDACRAAARLIARLVREKPNAVLGIGSDGHIGFNEPSSSLASRTRIKTLTPRTLQDNARFFEGDPDRVPRHCITMGIGTILHARRVVLLAFGAQKADAVAAMAEGPVTAMLPASALQLHPVAKVFLDEASASPAPTKSFSATSPSPKKAANSTSSCRRCNGT